MQYKNNLLPVLLAASILLIIPSQSFAQDTGYDNGPPPGIQDNPGLNGNGQGDTQGNHYGWYKHQTNNGQTGENLPPSNGDNGPGNRPSFDRGGWQQNHPQGREAMEDRRQERQEFMQNHPEMREQMEQRRAERKEYMQNHPEAREAMEQRRQERQEFGQNHPGMQEGREQRRDERRDFMQNHAEMREGMEQRHQQRQEFMQNHPEAREAMGQRRDRDEFRPRDRGQSGEGPQGGHQWQNHGSNGSIPGNAYGNGQVRGNGGQMGNSHSPHHN